MIGSSSTLHPSHPRHKKSNKLSGSREQISLRTCNMGIYFRSTFNILWARHRRCDGGKCVKVSPRKRKKALCEHTCHHITSCVTFYIAGARGNKIEFFFTITSQRRRPVEGYVCIAPRRTLNFDFPLPCNLMLRSRIRHNTFRGINPRIESIKSLDIMMFCCSFCADFYVFSRRDVCKMIRIVPMKLKAFRSSMETCFDF